MREINVPAMGLVLMVGASGSGKSTFAARHFLPTQVVSSDFCRGPAFGASARPVRLACPSLQSRQSDLKHSASRSQPRLRRPRQTSHSGNPTALR